MAVWGPITNAVGARWVFGVCAVFAAGAAVVGRVLTRGLATAGDVDRAQPASA